MNMPKIVGQHSFKIPHRCTACQHDLVACNVVITLPAGAGEPAEYEWVCPECGSMGNMVALDDEAAERYMAAMEAELAILRKELARLRK